MLNILLLAAVTVGGSSFVERKLLQKDFETLAAASDGTVGICALDHVDAEPVCVRGSEPLPLQSVMKLIVSAAALELIDRKLLKIDDTIKVKPEDSSPGPREFADLVRKQGHYTATIEELMRRSIVDSDSTTIDVLIEHLGGLASVQDFLKRKKIEGLRVDRNERDLQSDFYGLSWKRAYAAPDAFDAAIAAVHPAQREKAWTTYFKDPRDTASAAALVKFLKSLAAGEILSPASTQKLLSIMEMTVTGRDRLRAGLPQDWKIGHKTGTGGSWKGRASTTNDVGLLTAPDGSTVAIAVLISDSKQSSSERAAIIAGAARAVTQAWPKPKGKS